MIPLDDTVAVSSTEAMPAVVLTFLGLGDYHGCQDFIIQLFVDPSMKECKCSTCTFRAAAQPQVINKYNFFYRTRLSISNGPCPSECIQNPCVSKGKEVCFHRTPLTMRSDSVQSDSASIHLGYRHTICDVEHVAVVERNGQVTNPRWNCLG